jgi:hypothetical protein
MDYYLNATLIYKHIVTVLAFHVTCSHALAWASIGGVERQNPSIYTNQSFVNNLFFS